MHPENRSGVQLPEATGLSESENKIYKPSAGWQPVTKTPASMKRLKFSKDEGSEFYKELTERVDRYFEEKGNPKTGGRIMMFKIFMYFSLDVLFYALMITSTSGIAF
jgi:hypothetical protein